MELFDLVDMGDNVVGVTDKSTAHDTGQLHRVVAVYVFTDSGELYLQVHKSSGGLYDHSVGGHVTQGEDYAAAASREAGEELGIDQPLHHVSNFYSDEESCQHMFGLFECVADGAWRFEPNMEVAEIVPMRLDAVHQLMLSSPEKFTLGFMNTMREYRRLKTQ